MHDYPGAAYNPFTKNDIASLFATIYTEFNTLDSATQSVHGEPVWLQLPAYSIALVNTTTGGQ